MPTSTKPLHPDAPANSVVRALRYALYDWSREMPRSKRVLTWVGLCLQGFAIYAAITRSLAWPYMWPHGPWLFFSIWAIYVAGGMLMNAMVTSEFVRKTQLESDLSAARRIQQTLQPQGQVTLEGYLVDTHYSPYRDVGGDYFDFVELPNGRTLLVLADVAGKGMPAAMLAANVQAFVRSIAAVDPTPLTLAQQINQHLHRYTPADRFVTAVFLLLEHGSGAIAYVNAGHNAPILASRGASTSLDATGVPLGLFPDVGYEAGSCAIHPGDALLLFTDGLPDAIRSDDPEAGIRTILTSADPSVPALMRAVDPALRADDITLVLLRRRPA